MDKEGRLDRVQHGLLNRWSVHSLGVRVSCLLLIVLLTCCGGPTFQYSTEGPLVRLYYTPLKVIGFMAAHPHLLTYRDGKWNRWEIWQTKGLHGNPTHVYKDLRGLNDHFNSPVFTWYEWSGEEADRIISMLHIAHVDIYAYPYAGDYWFWPGPNSNTFITWILRQADVDEISFPWRAWGSSY